ncbi:hypothetical protein TcWFU_004154 [Taenia crassiceps]|uniref:Protein MCM10 homolog n=1 Tax=Taenia crassiceps TaxID=6207 RepID=A0ABR4QQF7_9CEST
MEPSFVLDTGGAGRTPNDGNIIYCPSKSSFGDPGEEESTPARSVITPPWVYFALHISHHDIPLHIYRMRSLGYPPGWLRKAKVEQLPLFDGEHEINSSLEVKYDEDAIIAYPGFNVCSSKLRDECYALQCPSMQRCHLLENFILSLRNSSNSILEVSRYKESLESKDLNDLEGERQRLLSEINALRNSLPSASSDHSESAKECKGSSKSHAGHSGSTLPREAPDDGRTSNPNQILPSNTEYASFNGTDRAWKMSDFATAEASFLGEVSKGSVVAEPAKEQMELEPEEVIQIQQTVNVMCHALRKSFPNSKLLALEFSLLSLTKIYPMLKEPVNPSSTAPRGGAGVRLERTQSVTAPITAKDINDFLAHSDNESSDSSDWNDVKEEAEGGEEVESWGRSATLCTVSAPSPVPLPARAQQSGMSEHGSRIPNSLSEIVPERHERRVGGESQRIIGDSEQVAYIGSNGPPTDSRRKALQICESKRANVLASLGSSGMGLSSYSPSLKSGEHFVAVPTNIRVMRPQISSELWVTRTSNRRVFSLAQYVREAAESSGSSLQTEATVLVGVIGSKMPPHRSRNNKIFSVWRLTDLMSVGTGAPNGYNISLFLFGAAHEKLWKEPEGTVVAILKPKLLPPNENSSLTSTSGAGLSITVDSAPFVMLLGMSPDFSLCAAITKLGRPCRRIVNKDVCRYCDSHVKTAYYSASSMRPGFATTSISKPGYRQHRGSKRSSGGPSASALSGSVFLLHHPTSMPVNRSQDTSSLNRLAVSSPSALNVAKFASTGNAIGQCSSSLSTASRSSFQVTSELEASFASSLTRPTQGSLNLLRYLEATNASHSAIPESSIKSKYLKNATFQAKSHKTFAAFFAGVKHKTLAQKPQIGRGLEVGTKDDHFIDLGPVSAKHSKLTANPTALPWHDAARRRTEALVQTKGGIGALQQSAREQTQKRILDVISRSTAKKPKPSPLTQILDSAPFLKTSTNPKQGISERIPKASDTSESEKREALARLVSQGSRHTDIAAANEASAEQKLLSRLEERDSIEQVLLNQHKQECQIVTCLRCQYRSLHVSQICRKEGHDLEFSTGVKRFFACRKCKTRTTTLDRYPNFACINCGESLFEKAGAIAERKGPKLAGEKLLVRGIEEKYLS